MRAIINVRLASIQNSRAKTNFVWRKLLVSNNVLEYRFLNLNVLLLLYECPQVSLCQDCWYSLHNFTNTVTKLCVRQILSILNVQF